MEPKGPFCSQQRTVTLVLRKTFAVAVPCFCKGSILKKHALVALLKRLFSEQKEQKQPKGQEK
jgi:hypothetical protein